MPLRVPPPEVPIVKWLSPNKADQGLIEFWNTEVASYVPLDIGAPHPKTREYPGFTLGRQAPMQGDEKWVMRIWVTPETSPDWFNWAEKYSAEDNAYPIFIRTYREPKNTYSPRTKAQPLGAFYKLVLDNAGSGFTPGTSPEVIFDADSDTPAIAHGVVGADGTLTECVLDFCGDGYTGNVAFRVDAPANGNPASGTAYVQPQTAILVKEEANPFPEESEFYAQYLQVLRVYETLPGPTLYSTKLDIDGATLTVGTTRKLCADIVTGEDITAGVWTKTTKHQTDTDFICEEVTETRAIPGIPMLSTVIDPNDDIMTQTKTMVAASSLLTTHTIIANVWTKTFQEDIDGTSLVAWKVVQVRNTQNELPFFSVEIPNLIPQEFRARLPTTTEETTEIGTASLPTLATGELLKSERQLDDYTFRRRTEFVPTDELPVTFTDQETTEEYGGGILNVTRTLDDSPLTVDEGLLVVSSYTKSFGASPDTLYFKETKVLDDTAWPILVGSEVDPRTGIVVGITKQVVDAGTLGGVGVDGYVDAKPIDKWRTLTIASKLDPDTLPDPLQWETTMEHRFPNTLEGLAWIWAAASAPFAYDFDMALVLDMVEGYAGPCRARITESFSNGAPADVVTPTIFCPQAHMLGFAWAFAADPSEDCGSCIGIARANARTWQIPPSLHEELEIGGAVTLDNGTFTNMLPATCPTGLPTPGSLITKACEVEEWRFGVFYRRLAEIYVPDCTCA